MARPFAQENRRASGYRLQTSAYAKREETPNASHSRFDLSNVRTPFAFHHSTDALPPSFGGFDTKPRSSLANPKTRRISKSLTQLPFITIEDIADNTPHVYWSSLHNIHNEDNYTNVLKQSYSHHLSHPSIPQSGAITTIQKSRAITGRLSINPIVAPGELKKKRRRFSLDDDPKRLAMKISLPCTKGCCYCAFTNLMGPVRIYVTRADKPKKEPLLLRFKDGNGNPVIPVSRKSDVRGLVYDPICHNLHPPVRGQRPVLQDKKMKPPVNPAGEPKNR